MREDVDNALNNFSSRIFERLSENMKKLGYSSITDGDVYMIEMAVRKDTDKLYGEREDTLETLVQSLKNIVNELETLEQEYTTKAFGDEWSVGYYTGRRDELKRVMASSRNLLNSLDMEV